MIVNGPEGDTFSIFDGLNEIDRKLISNTREINSNDEVLELNEIGKYNGVIAIGDGVSMFKDLNQFITLKDMASLIIEK